MVKKFELTYKITFETSGMKETNEIIDRLKEMGISIIDSGNIRIVDV